MERYPLVSVIMPFHNTSPDFICEAIESVVRQTYDRWELLIIDDGSTQVESTSTAQDYAARFPQNIRYLAHPDDRNRGASASRQVAIDQSRGSLIALLDADDLWLPEKLEEQVGILQEHPEVGALYGNTRYWHSWVDDPSAPARDFEPDLGLQTEMIYEPPSLLVRFVRGQVAIPCTCSIIVTREVIRDCGGFEFDYSGIYDDQIFYSKIALHTPIYVSRRVWDWYRQHPDSGCHQSERRGEMNALRTEYLDWLAGYLDRCGVGDTQLWSAVRRERWLYQPPRWIPERLHDRVRWLKKWMLRAEHALPVAAGRLGS